MGLETGTYVNDLNTANPTSTDPKSQGDDHLRLIKSVLKNTFAGFPGLVVATGTEAQGITVNDYVVTVSPAPAAYTANFFLAFKATHTNTNAVTIAINALTAKTLKGVDGAAVEAGDIESGGIVVAWYDGTDFFLISGNDRAARAGDTYTGVHDFSNATQVALPANTNIGNVSAAEIAILDGITASTAELNVLDGITASTAELNVLDGITASTVELNSVDGVTGNVQGQLNLKAPLESPALSGTPTAPTAATGTSTNQLATCAFVVATAFNAALPGQTGNANKFVTTDGVNAYWAAIPGQGGATASGSVALTVASGGEQVITPTANGQSITLPNATTLAKGITLYAIRNTSDKYQLGIRDAGGTLRDVIAPGGFCLCGLVDNSTVAGSWVFSNTMSDSMLVTGEAVRSTAYTNDPNSGSVLLGSTLLTLAQSGTSWYVQAYDTTSNTLGTPVLVATNPTWAPRLIALTATTALCLYRTSGYIINAVVVTISGSSCSLGVLSTSSTTFPSGGTYSYDTAQFMAVSSTLAVFTTLFLDGGVYYYSMCAISVSGTTATVGAAKLDLASNASASLSAYGQGAIIFAETPTRVFHTWCTGNQNTLEANVFSISGTTISAGSGASFAYSYTSGTARGLAIQAGKHFVSWYDGSTLKCRIYTISGTAVTANSTFDTTLNGTSAQFAQLIAYSATKIFYRFSATGQNKYGVLSESSGTLSDAVAPTDFNTTLLGGSFSGFVGNALYSATTSGSNRITYDGGTTIAYDAAIPLGRNSAKAGTYLGTVGTTLLFSGLVAFKNSLFNEFSSAKFTAPSSIQSLGGNKIAFFVQVAPNGGYAAYTCEVAQ